MRCSHENFQVFLVAVLFRTDRKKKNGALQWYRHAHRRKVASRDGSEPFILARQVPAPQSCVSHQFHLSPTPRVDVILHLSGKTLISFNFASRGILVATPSHPSALAHLALRSSQGTVMRRMHACTARIASGRKDQIAGKLQTRYGYAKDETERQVDELARSW